MVFFVFQFFALTFGKLFKDNSTKAVFPRNETVKNAYGFSKFMRLQPTTGSRTDECVYGRRNAVFSVALLEYLGLFIKICLACALFSFVAVVGYGIGSFPGIIATYYCLEIVLNIIYVNSNYFKFFVGPGPAYEKGVTANALLFGIYSLMIWLTRLFMTILILLGSIGAFSLESDVVENGLTGLRVAIGVACSLYMTVASTKFLYSEGIVSYFQGSMGDTLNGIGCSGPYSYRQLPTAVFLTEIMPIFTGLFRAAQLEGLYTSIYFICSCIVVFSGFNVFHSMNAVFYLGTIFLAFMIASCTIFSNTLRPSSLRYRTLS